MEVKKKDNPIKITTVTPIYPRGNFVEWSINFSELPISAPLRFIVERSESPNGPFEAVSKPYVENVVSFFDSLPSHFLSRFLYYRVSLIGVPNCKWVSEPEANLTSLHTLTDRMRGEVYKMRNDLHTLLVADNATEIKVFKRKNMGVFCQECTSTVLGLVVYSNCKTCFGTRIVGGFYNPIKTRALFSDPPVQEGMDTEGKTEMRMFNLRMLDTPLLTTDDILYEHATGAVYEVKQVVTTRRNRVIVHQEPTVSELERSHIYYSIVNGINQNPLGTEIAVF